MCVSLTSWGGLGSSGHAVVMDWYGTLAKAHDHNYARTALSADAVHVCRARHSLMSTCMSRSGGCDPSTPAPPTVYSLLLSIPAMSSPKVPALLVFHVLPCPMRLAPESVEMLRGAASAIPKRLYLKSVEKKSATL